MNLTTFIIVVLLLLLIALIVESYSSYKHLKLLSTKIETLPELKAKLFTLVSIQLLSKGSKFNELVKTTIPKLINNKKSE